MLTATYRYFYCHWTAFNLIALLIAGSSLLCSKAYSVGFEDNSESQALSLLQEDETQWFKELGIVRAQAARNDETALTAMGKIFDAGSSAIALIPKRLGCCGRIQPLGNRTAVRVGRAAEAAATMLASRDALAWGLSSLALIYKVQGNSEQAIVLLKTALQIAASEARPNPYRLGVIANRLALSYASSSRAADAEAYFRQSVDAFQKSGEGGKDLAAGALHNLALFYGKEHRYAEAADAALNSLRLLTEGAEPDRSRLFNVLNTLAGAYNAQGRYEEAEQTLLRAFAIAHTAFTASDRKLSRVTANLASVYKAEGRADEAIGLFNLALEEAGIACGASDIWVGMIANRLAVTLLEQGKTADAERLFKRAVSIGENNSGEESLFLAAAQFNLSALYARQGRYEEAKALLNRALAIRLSAYGLNHPAVAEAESALKTVKEALIQQAAPSPRVAGSGHF